MVAPSEPLILKNIAVCIFLNLSFNATTKKITNQIVQPQQILKELHISRFNQKKMKIGILFSVFFVFLKKTQCIETFSAIADLKLMLKTESSLAGHLKEYIGKEYQRLRKLEKLVYFN